MKNLSGDKATGKREWWWEVEGKFTKLNLGVTPQSDDKKKGRDLNIFTNQKKYIA